MIRLLANMKSFISLTFTLILTSTTPVNSAEIVNFSYAPHQYSSYAAFASSACLPCHYRNIPNGTDLYELFHNATEEELKSFLLPILKEGNMPPDKTYRKTLYKKLLQIKDTTGTK